MTDNFYFQVSEPEQRKGEGLGLMSFWLYKIRARINLQQYARKELEVLRRYSDFEWLRARLGEDYPFCIIPPIPEKDVVQGTLEKIAPNAKDTKLLDYRQRALRKFLTRVGAHPTLYNSKLLQDFLEMDDKEWEMHMKVPRKPQPEQHIVTALEAALSKQWYPKAATTDAAAGAAYTKALADPPATPQTWEETKTYLSKFELSLGVLRERVNNLVKRRREASNALKCFSDNFTKVGEIEGSIENTPLSTAIQAVGNHTRSMSSVYLELADSESTKVVESLTYYVRVCGAVREGLDRLLRLVEARDKLIHQSEDLKAQRERLSAKGEREKLTKVEQQLYTVTEGRDHATKQVESVEILFKQEMRRFHHDKQFDMKSVLQSFAELQMDYASKMKTGWEALQPTVENIKK